MIVYGDPQFSASVSQLAAALRWRAGKTDSSSMDELRELLIGAGQIEQALADYSMEPLSVAFTAPTDFAATAFYAAYAGQDALLPCPQMSTSEALRCFIEALQSCEWPDRMIKVKVPEGFAFYTLFPEQYCRAALAWAKEHAASKEPVVVAGIRSIGTTLSAVVTQTLLAVGRAVIRFTVRPTGHPFRRRTTFASQIPPGALALIVDEGPGLSGSSMASAASALIEAGISPEKISFLPGHGGEPGHAAEAAVRHWWRTTPRFNVPLDQVRWNGRTLNEDLLRQSRLMGRHVVNRVENFGGGSWRKFNYSGQAEWPPVAAPFEAAKFACLLGEQPRAMWKFAGLTLTPGFERSTAEARFRKLQRLAAEGWTTTPLTPFRGFVGQTWIEGRPLNRRDVSEPLLQKMGQYIAAAKGEPLGRFAAHDALVRLQEMVLANCMELSQRLGERARLISTQITADEKTPCFGDGRMSPHKWVLTTEGRLTKRDAAGHELDHTVIGPQPIYWDIAGVVAEWNLTTATMLPLLRALRESYVQVDLQTLGFYDLAYCAFRVGQFHLCRTLHPVDGAEKGRMLAAEQYFRTRIERLLVEPAV